MADAEERLREILRSIAQEQGYDSQEIEVKPINSGGANYTTRLFVITISAPGKSDLKLFAKVAALGEKIRSTSDVQMYNIETHFYTKILDKYRELEARHNIPANERIISPKYYGGSTEYMSETIVLEELTSKGYQFFDRFKCFDWEYASKCVSSLATQHALSVAHKRHYPEHFQQTVDAIKVEFSAENLKTFMEKSIDNAIEATEDAYRDRLRRYFEKELNTYNVKKFFHAEQPIVLNHGDFKPSNILHKRDEDGKLQIMVVDYQATQPGNPVGDLVYFLVCGSDEEFREKHLQQLFDHYYEEFSRKLRRFEVDPDGVYPQEQYRSDVKEMLPFGLAVGMFILPFVTVGEDEAPKPEDGIDIDSFKLGVSDGFRARFGGLLKDYAELGFL